MYDFTQELIFAPITVVSWFRINSLAGFVASVVLSRIGECVSLWMVARFFTSKDAMKRVAKVQPASSDQQNRRASAVAVKAVNRNRRFIAAVTIGSVFAEQAAAILGCGIAFLFQPTQQFALRAALVFLLEVIEDIVKRRICHAFQVDLNIPIPFTSKGLWAATIGGGGCGFTYCLVGLISPCLRGGF
jgi:hypothetical protein